MTKTELIVATHKSYPEIIHGLSKQEQHNASVQKIQSNFKKPILCYFALKNEKINGKKRK